MQKKLVAGIIGLSMFSMFVPPINAAVTKKTYLCGVDGKNYATAAAAEAAGVEISYEKACVSTTSEKGQTEKKNSIQFAGALLEIGSTDLPANIVVRDNKTKIDQIVSVSQKTLFGTNKNQVSQLADWIAGDQIRVIGVKNENTGIIEATRVINTSLVSKAGINGYVTKIDTAKKLVYYAGGANKAEKAFAYATSTKFIVGTSTSASVTNLKINDRIRVRAYLRKGTEPMALIVMVLKRGTETLVKMKTVVFNVTLVRLDSTVTPTTVQVKIVKTPTLRKNDANNLVGNEGDLVTLNVKEDTRIVRKYFGRTSLAELSVGDSLMIVGRVNADKTVNAQLIKDNSIWKTGLTGHAGVVTDINVAASFLTMNWVPVKQLTEKQKKEAIKEQARKVKTQIVAAQNQDTVVKNGNKTVMSKLKEKVGNFERKIKEKQVKIDNIKRGNLKLGDLVKKMPAKKMKVIVNKETKIIIGTNTNAALADVKSGDKIRVRGTRNELAGTITADTITVVAKLAELDEPLSSTLDAMNATVAQLETTNTATAIAPNTNSATETEIKTEIATSTPAVPVVNNSAVSTSTQPTL